MVAANVTVKSFEFWVVAVYAPSSVSKRRSFFRRLEPLLDDPKGIILVGDWNAILGPKIDKDGWGASGSLAVSKRRSLRTPMILLTLCPVDRT